MDGGLRAVPTNCWVQGGEGRVVARGADVVSCSHTNPLPCRLIIWPFSEVGNSAVDVSLSYYGKYVHYLNKVKYLYYISGHHSCRQLNSTHSVFDRF